MAVFWIDAEDHDLDEIRTCGVLDADQGLATVTLETPAAAGASPDLLLRMLREVMILSRIEQQRMANREGEEESWGKVAALVDEALAAEEGME